MNKPKFKVGQQVWFLQSTGHECPTCKQKTIFKWAIAPSIRSITGIAQSDLNDYTGYQIGGQHYHQMENDLFLDKDEAQVECDRRNES